MTRTPAAKATTIAHQKLRRDGHLAEGTPAVPHLSVKRAHVRAVSRAVAKRIILKYEWLGTMAPTAAHYGIFFGEFCAGVCCIAVNGTGAAGSHSHKQFKVERRELGTLARGACVHWAPKGANSKLIAWSLRLLARDYPEPRLVIAYSDPDAGEIGTVYQATNWTYIGPSPPQGDKELVSSKGRVLNVRSVGHYMKRNRMTWREAMAALESAGWRHQKRSSKGRYVFVLRKTDRELVDHVATLAQPYPKREDSNPAAQAGDGGTPDGAGRFDSDPAAPSEVD